MNRIQEIKITLKNGKISLNLNGFQGTECDSLAAIEESLGTIVNKEATDEAYVEVQELPEFVRQGI